MPHVFETTMTVPRPRPEAFAFFSDVANLQRITPPELGFVILTPLPVAMAPGALIDYRLRLFGVPMRWQTIITHWQPNDEFVDEQRRGPYRRWVHTHRFRDVPGGTEIRDHVLYELPFVPFGVAVLPLVRAQLTRIFDYRRAAIARMLAPD